MIREAITNISTGEVIIIEDDTVIPEMVNVERDRRLILPFAFGGKMYQRDAQSVLRINGAVSMALAAIQAGTPPNAALWVNGGPFRWITADNSVAELTPAEVISLGMACAKVESDLVFAARELKDMNPIPLDFADDEYWT